MANDNELLHSFPPLVKHSQCLWLPRAPKAVVRWTTRTAKHRIENEVFPMFGPSPSWHNEQGIFSMKRLLDKRCVF
jgi:hypothetical protein